MSSMCCVKEVRSQYRRCVQECSMVLTQPFLLPMACGKSLHSRVLEATCGFKTASPVLKTDLATAREECAVTQWQTPTVSPNINSITSSLMAVHYTELFLTQTGSILCLRHTGDRVLPQSHVVLELPRPYTVPFPLKSQTLLLLTQDITSEQMKCSSSRCS